MASMRTMRSLIRADMTRCRNLAKNAEEKSGADSDSAAMMARISLSAHSICVKSSSMRAIFPFPLVVIPSILR